VLLFALSAFAGDFMDTWIVTALEEDNLLAGPEAYSPSGNFVMRGNNTFFETYETRFTDDLTQSHIVLYRRDDGFNPRIFTEAAFVLRFAPYLNPDGTEPGVSVADDGSYARVVLKLGDRDDHNLSLTGYAVDANRFRLGYSYDLTWGGRNLYAFDPMAAPGVRLQYQNGPHSAFVGLKTAVGDYVDPLTGITRNQAYYGFLAGGGLQPFDLMRVDVGGGWFQQGQLTNVSDTTSPIYNAAIIASGACAQLSFRTNPDLDFITSNELKLYRNAPEFVRDTYFSHRKLEGFGLLLQTEVNYLSHNLIDPEHLNSTTIERAVAGDVQVLAVFGTTELGIDFVYKDLPYILFNIPGITSGYAISPNIETKPQRYVRAQLSHWFEEAHLTPSLGLGYLMPASYKTSTGTFVQYSERDKGNVPDGQQAADLLSGVVGLQWDISKSMIWVGEVLYTLDNNKSVFQQTDGSVGENVPAPANWRNELGFNIMLRARF
jgi:hypothetical protein